MKVHRIKTHTEWWDQVWRGNKSFEIRKNDRGYELGDTVELVRWNKERDCEEPWIGPSRTPYLTLSAEITCIIKDYPGIEEGYCVFCFNSGGMRADSV